MRRSHLMTRSLPEFSVGMLAALLALCALAGAGGARAALQGTPAVSFTDVAAGLPGNYYSSIAWGDYDNDGDLDILLAGGVTTGFTTVMRNDGGSFTDVAHLPQAEIGAADWGDFDNDGDLDILLTGNTSAHFSRVYRNDAGSFVDSGAILQGVYYSAVDWGDFDNDGDLDILLCGYADSGRVSTVYRNDGGNFTALDLGLPGVHRGNAAWGDYDNDGDLDILLTGSSSTGPMARVYANNGGTFTPISFTSSLSYPSACWGDYDGDGDLDLLLSGTSSKIYRNDGGTFNDSGIALPYMYDGDAAWGDFDNDGDLDVAMAGKDFAASTIYARVYRNDGGTVFTNVNAGLEPVDRASVAWGDYDNDGDLDLLLCGYGAGGRVTRLYSNDGAWANTPPITPTGLAASVVDNQLTTSWNATTDAETPAAALSYNLRVGTTPGGNEVMSAMADEASGFRRVARPGNAQQRISWTLTIPPADEIYWSVQAVDGAFAGSPFAPEKHAGPPPTPSFTDIGAGLPGNYYSSIAWGDYDNDGDLDILLAGGVTTGFTTVMRNDGGSFTDVAHLPQAEIGAADWGDFDNDGDLDILLTGNPSARFGRVYRNDAGSFVDSGAILQGVYASAVDWGDFDNDGDLDILLCGYADSGRVSTVYRNDGGTFAALDVGLADVGGGDAVWGDYDNDGDLDILLTGSADAGPIALVYENNGGTFTDSGFSSQMNYPSAGWGDYDGDGDLDLLLSRYSSSVYRNDGGTFHDAGIALPGLINGDAAWGDFDNDGDLDLAMAGKIWPSNEIYARVYRNDGVAGFTDVNAGLEPVDQSSVAWGDYDNDGDLDLLLCGYGAGGRLTRLYSNDGAWANTPPVTPTGLAASVVDNQLTMSWNATTDAETPAAALSYNLRLGTTPGGSEIMSAMADGASGYRRIADLGNAQQSASWSIDLSAGQDSVYWSVQAVDGAFAGSPFPAEQRSVGYTEWIGWTDETTAPLANAGPGRGAAWGDYDGDGDPDLYLTNSGQADVLYRNDAGVMTPVTGGALGNIAGGYGVAWADYDGDDDLDLFLAVSGGNGKLLRNDGSDLFTDITSAALGSTGSCNAASWADYDNDGLLDLYIVRDGATNRLYHNDGDGTLTETSSAPVNYFDGNRSATWADYDDDGDLDLFLTSSYAANKLLRNDGGGAFADVTSGQLGWVGHSVSGAWGDYDNDGDLDLYVANFGAPNQLLRNDGSDVFVEVTSGPLGDTGSAVDASWADYDNDGDLDIFVANYNAEPDRLLRNDGSGIFVQAPFTNFEGLLVGHTSVWADYDLDGDLDLYVVNTNQANQLFGNRTTAGNHWLHVNLDGVASSAIGARVRVIAGGMVQTRQVGCGAGWTSQNSQVAAFGLGAATVVDSLEVWWPSGLKTVRTDIPADQVLQLPEMEYDASAMGRYLGRCLGLDNGQIYSTYLECWGLTGGLNANMPEAALFCASGDSVEGTVLLSTGKARDGGLGDTDWGDKPGFETTVWGFHTYVPAGAKSLRFTTQLISAEFDAGRPGVDYVDFSFWDAAWQFQDAHLDTVASMCSGPVSPSLNHAFDVSHLAGGGVFYLQFRVGENSSYSDIDTAMKISRFHFSDEPLPPPETPLPPDAPVNYIQTPIFSDVGLIAGSYTYSKDLLEIPGPMPLRLSLTYNSDSVRDGRLGPKWSHGYELYLLKLDDNRVLIRHGNGQTTYFKPDGGGGYQPMYDGSHATLAETSPGYFTYVTESQLTYEFTPNATWSNYGELAVIRDANGNETTLTHSTTSDRLLERVDQIATASHQIQLSYALVDTVQRMTGVAVNGQQVAGFQYDGAGHLTGIQEYPLPGSKASPIPTAITYDAQGRILTVTNGAGETEVSNTYRGTLLVSQQNAAGVVSHTQYDQARLVHVDRLGRQTIRTYDIKGRLARLERPGGGTATYEYDGNGNLSVLTDALGATTQMEYDSAGNLTRKTDALGHVTTMTYDERGNMLTQTGPGGKTQTYTYDASNKVLTETNPLGHTKTNTYNAAGQLATETDAAGRTTSYVYDGNKFLQRRTDAAGGVTQFTRDVFGHPLTITDPEGNTTVCSYTVDGRLLSRTDPLGTTTQFTYDGAGRVLTETTDNAPGYPIVTSYTYTPTGQVATTTDGAGLVTSFEYDAEGQRTGVTDPLGRTTQFAYDEEGRVIAVTDPEGGVAQASYNACTRLNVTGPGGHTATSDYDLLGRVVRETDGLGSTLLYTYDANGLIATMVNGRFQTFSYTYDDAGRLTQENFPGGSITHTLDANGNETATSGSALGSVSRTFDEVNRLVSRQGAQGRTVGYEYDSIGNVTAVIYPDGARVVYGYDAANRLITTTDWLNRTTTYTYTQGGDVLHVSRPDGSRVDFGYDNGQRLVAMADSSGVEATALYAVNFVLNAASQRTTATLVLPLQPEPQEVYKRLEYVANVLTSADEQAYTYDGDGNMVLGMLNGTMKDLEYDALGHLIRCGTDLYEYDTDGYRVASVINGVERHYVYDTLAGTPRLLAEYDEAGSIVARYVHGVGLISREDAAGQVSYYHHDALGSTVALTRADGTTSDRYAYGAYGELLGRDGTTPNPFLFIGSQGVMDDGNGLYLMRTRYYAPELMRFVQKDAAYGGDLQNTQTLNRYAYGEGNPIQNIDPNGLWSLKKAWKNAKSAVKSAAVATKTWVVENREGIARVTAVVAGIAAGVAATAACGGNPVCGIVAGVAAANLVGNAIGGGMTGESDWKFNYGAVAEAMPYVKIGADWAAAKLTGCLEDDNPACWAGCRAAPLLCGGLVAYDKVTNLIESKTGPTIPGVPAPNNSSGGQSGQHDQMNDFRPARDGFDGAMSQTREARMNAWGLTESVCPMKQ